MKKLLALILCVMMFVAVIPTAAFAVSIPTGAVPTTSGKYVPAWVSKYTAQKAVDAASDNIMALYQTLAADKGVYATVAAIDGVVAGISDQLWADVDDATIAGLKLTGAQWNDVTKGLMRNIIGSEIMNYMNDHYAKFAKHTAVLDADGNLVGTITKIDPVKYMDAFATAASKAIGSEKAITNIQAIMLALAAGQQYNDFLDDLKDLRNDIALDADGDGAAIWAEYFAGQDVLPVVEGGDLYMLPYALIEPYTGLDTSDYSYVYGDLVKSALGAGQEIVFPES